MNQLIEATLEDLVAKIENGTGDWIHDWVGGGVPRNHTTSRRYHGINILLLWAAKEASNFPTGDWATYKQWAASGHQVKRGEKSSTIFISKDALKRGGDAANPDDHYRLLRCAFVFNAAQLVEPPATVTEPVTPIQRIERCEKLVAATGATFEVADHPAYVPGRDVIKMPPIVGFISSEGYYATVFHELVHWTGHKTRLDRLLSYSFDARIGNSDYAFEELVAEFGQAFLCAELGVYGVNENAAAYLRNWLKAVKQDRGAALMKAASLASKAHEYLVSRETKTEDAMAA